MAVVEELVARLGFRVDGASQLRRAALLWRRLTARIDKFAAALSRRLGRAGRVMARFIGLMARGLLAVVRRAAVAFGGLGVLVTGLTASFARMASNLAKVRAETVRLGQSAGVNAGKLEALAQAMGLEGVDIKTARKTLTEWADTLRKEVVEGGELVDELNRRGVRLFDGTGKNRRLRDPANIFRDYIGALERIQGDIEKLRSLDQAGIDDANVRALLLRGGAAIDQAIVAASRLGLLFTKEQADQAERFSAATSKIGAALRGISDAAASEAIELLLPKFQELAVWFEGPGGQGLRDAAVAIARAIIAAFEGVERTIRAVIAAVDALRGAVSWLNQYLTAAQESARPPTVSPPGDVPPARRMLEGAEPNESDEWRKRRQEKARRMLEDDRQRGIDPTVNPLMERLNRFFGWFSSAAPAVRQEINPATVASKMVSERETQQAIDNRRYENVGNDNRNVSVNVNANVSGLEGLKSSILNSLGSVLSKSSNAATSFATQP